MHEVIDSFFERLDELNISVKNIEEEQIKQITEDLLNIKEPNKIMLQKLIRKIGFDKNNNIKIEVTFKKVNKTI